MKRRPTETQIIRIALVGVKLRVPKPASATASTRRRPLVPALVLMLTLMHAACQPAPAPATPEIALQSASTRIDSILAEHAAAKLRRAPAPSPVAPTQGDTVRFWYYAHPLIGPAIEGDGLELPSATLEPQFIGEWDAAIQKLAVAFATDELPAVAMVKRGLVAKLYEAGRIVPLDTILPTPFLDDLRPEVRVDYTYDGHLIALPADGFCSVMYFNERSVGPTPPRTWTFLTAHLNAQHASPGLPDARGLGAFPYAEALWSAGGDFMAGASSGLASPAATRALAYTLQRTAENPQNEARGFESFRNGDIAITVASSSRLGSARKLPFPNGIAPIPGETGPISRRSNDAVVVFAGERGASAEAVGEFLDWLTGPAVMGNAAALTGSVPIRSSTPAPDLAPSLEEAYAAARNTPLHPEWNAIEFEAEQGLEQAYRAAPAVP